MKRVLLLLLCVVLVAVLAVSVVPGTADETDTLSIYYPVPQEEMTSGGDAITAIRVDWRAMRSQPAQAQAEEVLRLLLSNYQDSAFRRLVPGGTWVQSCQITGSTAIVDFSSAYGQLSGMDLTMADYCVALSLVQIPGIYTVRITVNGRELAYRDKNYFRADDVLVTSPEDVVRNLAVQLYFFSGTALVPEERILTVYEGESQAGAVIDALLEGPISESLQPLLPEGFAILGARVEENICYLNLAGSSETALPDDSFRQYQIVMGMVRSLCSIRDVRQVQILMEGERQAVFGRIDISQPLTAVS